MHSTIHSDAVWRLPPGRTRAHRPQPATIAMLLEYTIRTLCRPNGRPTQRMTAARRALAAELAIGGGRLLQFLRVVVQGDHTVVPAFAAVDDAGPL